MCLPTGITFSKHFPLFINSLQTKVKEYNFKTYFVPYTVYIPFKIGFSLSLFCVCARARARARALLPSLAFQNEIKVVHISRQIIA